MAAADDNLVRGRDALGRHAWTDTYMRLSPADREEPLEPDDLEQLATAAYLIGKDAAGAAAEELMSLAAEFDAPVRTAMAHRLVGRCGSPKAMHERRSRCSAYAYQHNLM